MAQPNVVIEQKALLVSPNLQAFIIEHELSQNHNLWDLPGGPLDLPDSLRTSLLKQVKSLTGLDIITVSVPLNITLFLDPVDRSRQILRLTYMCQVSESLVTLPNPGRGFLWIDPASHAEFPFPDESYKLIFEQYSQNRDKLSHEFLGKGTTSDTLDYLRNKIPNPLY